MHELRAMVLEILVPALALVLGAMIYALAGNPKLAELGRLLFLAGALVLLYVIGARVVRL